MTSPNVNKSSERSRALVRVFFGTLIALGLIAGGAGISIAVAPEKERPQFEKRPLPKEWRWSPPAVKYEHMYRK